MKTVACVLIVLGLVLLVPVIKELFNYNGIDFGGFLIGIIFPAIIAGILFIIATVMLSKRKNS